MYFTLFNDLPMCFRAAESVVEDMAGVGHLFRSARVTHALVTVRDVAGDCRPPLLEGGQVFFS
jgi:hypothetical protein